MVGTTLRGTSLEPRVQNEIKQEQQDISKEGVTPSFASLNTPEGLQPPSTIQKDQDTSQYNTTEHQATHDQKEKASLTTTPSDLASAEKHALTPTTLSSPNYLPSSYTGPVESEPQRHALTLASLALNQTLLDPGGNTPPPISSPGMKRLMQPRARVDEMSCVYDFVYGSRRESGGGDNI